jgi:hypothetical protein
MTSKTRLDINCSEVGGITSDDTGLAELVFSKYIKAMVDGERAVKHGGHMANSLNCQITVIFWSILIVLALTCD